MHLKIKGKIIIQECDKKVLRDLKEYLTIANPQYQMALAMIKKDASKRRMLYAIPPNFKYYKEKKEAIEIGRGAIYVLYGLINKYNVKITSKVDRFVRMVDEKLPIKTVPREYQIGRDNIVLKNKQGIIKLGTGWGKTIFSFMLAEKTQLKTLIVCCKNESNEFAKYKFDFKELYGEKIGTIQGKKFDIKNVTVATASTLVKRKFKGDEFGMVIVDECHVGMSKKRLKAFQQFDCDRFYGMSGTPGRANGQGKSLEFYYGNILIDEKLPQDMPDVQIYKTNVPLIGSEYYEMEEQVVDNQGRNILIINIIKKLLQKNRRILILTKRIEHGKAIQELLNVQSSFKVESYAMSSKDTASMRSELIQAFREESRDFQVLIGTYGLFSTGTDIPLIDTVLLAMSVKVDGDYDATLMQSIGRALRLHDKKKTPLVIDLDDNLNKIMHRHHLSRMSVYKREGWSVELMN